MADVRELARLHVQVALAELARLARGAESETVRLAAIRELFDRAHGRPGSPDGAADTLHYVLVDDGYRD